VRKLLNDNALGSVMEAEIHYDFESPSWLKYLTEKKYTPGSGLAFGLGTHSLDHAVQLFGVPKSVTAIFRNQREIESEIEDSFTILLHYHGAQKELLVTVKTSVVTPMTKQLKYWLRGTKGSFMKFQQRSTCPQEEQIAAGIKVDDPNFGAEPQELEGVLTTYEVYDKTVQEFDEKTNKYTGRYPTVRGRWVGLYENVADAINGKGDLHVKASQSRDVLRLIELARESAEKGITVAWR
jgi:predicted dehydrogenase